MLVICSDCGQRYEDVYRLTYCPHARFEMQTLVSNGRETVLCTTVEQVRALFDRWKRGPREEPTMVRLGQQVRDSVTGFEGVATARTEYMNGCIRVQVEAVGMHDGKPIEPQWFDEQRLTAASMATAGGPGPVPPARDPRR